MAFNAGTVKGTLELNTSRFKKGADVARKGLASIGTAAKGARGALGGFRGALSTASNAAIVGRAAFDSLRRVVSGVVGVFSRASKAQQEYEQSVQSLAAGLVQTGAPSIAKTTAELENLATLIQDTTRFNDTDVLTVAKGLAAFGAEADKLSDYTTAVLNFSEAFGTNFTTSARAFGQALAGNGATLARYFPQVRELTLEQLKAGGAFDLAAKSLDGYAEIAGRSTAGSLSRLQNVLNDLQKRLGEAINQFLGPLADQLKVIFRELVKNLDEGDAGFEAMIDTMRAGFATALQVVRLLIDSFYNVRIAFGQLQVFGALFQETWVNSITGIVTAFAWLSQVIADIITSASEFVAALPGIPDSIRNALQSVADFSKDVSEGNQRTLDEMENLRQAARDVVTERRKEVITLKANLEAIQQNKQTEDAWLNTVTGIYNLRVQQSREEKAQRDLANQRLADERRIADQIEKQREAVRKRLEHLREINGVSGTAFRTAEATAEAAETIAEAADSAAGSVGQMADEFGRAAQGAAATASATAETAQAAGGGAFAGTRTLSASRTVESRTGLDFSDPFRATALAAQATATLGRISSGGKRADIGFSGVRAARAFADSVRAEAAAAVDRAIADYTGTIIQELNSAGVMSPDERSRIIRQRISEAQRLGIVPSRGSLELTNVGLQ